LFRDECANGVEDEEIDLLEICGRKRPEGKKKMAKNTCSNMPGGKHPLGGARPKHPMGETPMRHPLAHAQPPKPPMNAPPVGPPPPPSAPMPQLPPMPPVVAPVTGT
jgi:hypothetical protein